MKIMKKLAAVCLAGAMVASLAACGASEADRMTAFVQGYLDMTYKGQFNEDFLKEWDMTEAEAQEQYEQGLGYEAEFFEGIAMIEYPSDELHQELVDMYKQIYSHSDYTVGKGDKLSSGNFAVEVTFKPIDIMTKFTPEDFQLVFEEVAAAHGVTDNESLNAMSESDYQALDAEYAAKVVEMVKAELPNIGYGDEKSIVVQIKNGATSYEPVQEDFNKIDDALIDYTSFGYGY